MYYTKQHLTFWAFIFSSALLFSSCQSSGKKTAKLEQKVDSLQMVVAHQYKPGFGEFMGYIQVHHAKLWYAGKNENWDLAQFELDEIMETVENIQTYEQDRPESKEISMIKAPLDNVQVAIKAKNPALFKQHFITLTNTCNSCHRITNFSFNKIKIPDTPPFTNQDFGK